MKLSTIYMRRIPSWLGAVIIIFALTVDARAQRKVDWSAYVDKGAASTPASAPATTKPAPTAKPRAKKVARAKKAKAAKVKARAKKTKKSRRK